MNFMKQVDLVEDRRTKEEDDENVMRQENRTGNVKETTYILPQEAKKAARIQTTTSTQLQHIETTGT